MAAEYYGHNDLAGSNIAIQAPCAGEGATDLSPASPTDQYRAGPIQSPGSYKIWYGKRTGTQIGQPDNWNTLPVELLGGKFYVFDVSTGDFSSANPQMINPLLSNPTPGESVVWYKASTQYAYVVCFDGPLNSNKGTVQESNGFMWAVVDDPFPSGPSNWVVQNGTLKQLSNIYRTDREYEFYQGTHIVAGSPDWTDYVLSFDMKSADNDGIGAIVRYQDRDNYYRFIMAQDSGNKGPFHRLEKFVNGVRTVLDEDKNGYSPGQVYRIQFKALGNDLEVWMDGSKILSAADETFRSGKIGFLSYASQDMEIANVKVVDQHGNPLAGIVGQNVGSTKAPRAPCGEGATDLSPASPTDQYRAGPIQSPGSYKIWYGKRTGTQIGQPDNWNTLPVELLGGKFYVFDVSTGDFSSANPQMINPLLSNPTPGESVVWYKASTQYAYVVCFDGPLNSNKGAVQLSGSWKIAGHQTGFNDWEADLTLNTDGTLSWTETKGANVGATRTGTWQFDGTTFTMTWISPGGGKTNWVSRPVTENNMGDGTYTVENAPGGTWTATSASTMPPTTQTIQVAPTKSTIGLSPGAGPVDWFQKK